MKNKLLNKNFIYLNLILVLYSLSTVSSKYASKNDFLAPKFIMFYGITIAFLFIYAILWQQILKRMQVTSAYANKAIVIIWGMIWGSLLFNEAITLKMISGAVIILFGVYLVVSDSE